MIKAVNKTHQTAINKAYKAIRNYHELVNLSDSATSEKEVTKLENKQAKAFDKYEEICGELPAREIKNLQAAHKAIHGYEA